MARPIVDHIGIIVEDLERSLTLFERLFDLRPTVIQEMEEVGLRIAELKAANIAIELIQYMGDGESFGRKVMGPRPGANHFSFRVEDVDAAVNRFKNSGVTPLEGFPRKGSHGRVAFFEPETTEKILMEVCGP